MSDPRVADFDTILLNHLNRRELLKRSALLGLAPTILGGLTAGPAGAAIEAVSTDQLRVVPTGAPTTLDPAKWAAAWDQWPLLCMFEGLVSFKPGTRTLVNVLAKQIDVSKDGKRITFELKRGIQFHGGFGEVTAEDVKFSFERIAGIQQKDLGSTVGPDWAPLVGVNVTGRYTGVIRLRYYFAPLMVSTLPGSSGFIVSKKAVEKYGKRFATNPVGTGPYELETYRPGNTLSMKKFAGYGGSSSSLARPPQWKKIVMPLAGAAATDVALLSGSAEVAQLPVDLIARIRRNSSFRVDSADTSDYSWINMNQKAPGLENILVRKAIRSAIDVPSIMTAAFNNMWPRATGPVSRVIEDGYWKGAPVYRHNVDQARSLMRAAGVKKLDLSLTINTGDIGAKALAQVVQANLKDIGINVDVEAVDTGTFFTLGKNLRKRQLTYMTYSSLADPAWVLQWFTCDQFDEWNWMYWCNSTFDGRFAQALREKNPKKRAALYIEMQKVWDRAANVVWITWPRNYFGLKKEIRASFTYWGWPVLWNFRA